MKWILLIVMGSQIHGVEFSSQDNCLKAADQLARQIQVICVEK